MGVYRLCLPLTTPTSSLSGPVSSGAVRSLPQRCSPAALTPCHRAADALRLSEPALPPVTCWLRDKRFCRSHIGWKIHKIWQNLKASLKARRKPQQMKDCKAIRAGQALVICLKYCHQWVFPIPGKPDGVWRAFSKCLHLSCCFKQLSFYFEAFSGVFYGVGQVEGMHGFWEDVVKVVLITEREVRVFDVTEMAAEPWV